MKQELIDQITEKLKNCTDPNLVELILKLLIESGY